MVDEESWGWGDGSSGSLKGLLESGGIKRSEVCIGDEDVGRRGQVTDQVLCDEIAPETKISDNALPAQDADLGGLRHCEGGYR